MQSRKSLSLRPHHGIHRIFPGWSVPPSNCRKHHRCNAHRWMGALTYSNGRCPCRRDGNKTQSMEHLRNSAGITVPRQRFRYRDAHSHPQSFRILLNGKTSWWDPIYKQTAGMLSEKCVEFHKRHIRPRPLWDVSTWLALRS